MHGAWRPRKKINAEPLDAALGCAFEGCTEHNMRGHPMAAVKMSKRLR
jgi:hypothetical protein